MCGIIGLISKSKWGFSHKELDLFETLLHVDTLRGEDSTGVYLVDTNGNVQIAKAAITGCNFLTSKEWRDMRASAIKNGWVLVGHNRKATRGSIIDENAHPFWVDDKIVLVHNGSFVGGHKHLADTEVDSHALAHVLAEHIGDPETALRKVNAAYALMFYDVPNKTFNIIRNSQRPLAHTSNTNAWIFTSEESILQFCYKRVYGSEAPNVASQPIHTLTSWALQQDKSSKLSNEELDCSFRGQVQTVKAAWVEDEHTCAYGTWGGALATAWKEEEQKQQAQTPLVLPPLPELFKAYLERRSGIQYDWQHKLPYGRFKALRDGGLLADDTRIRVVVADYDLNLDENNDTVLLIGEWVNHDATVCLPVVFPITAGELEVEMNTEGDSVYYVTVKNHFWQSNGVGDANQDNIRGFPYLFATSPTKLIISKHNQVH